MPSTTYKTDLCKAAGLVPYTNDTLTASDTYSQSYATAAEFHAALAGFDVFIDETYHSSPSTADMQPDAVSGSTQVSTVLRLGNPEYIRERREMH